MNDKRMGLLHNVASCWLPVGLKSIIFLATSSSRTTQEANFLASICVNPQTLTTVSKCSLISLVLWGLHVTRTLQFRYFSCLITLSTSMLLLIASSSRPSRISKHLLPKCSIRLSSFSGVIPKPLSSGLWVIITFSRVSFGWTDFKTQ